MVTLLNGHPNERPTPLERPLDNVNLNIDVFTLTPDKKLPLLKGHISDENWLASQEGLHCILLEADTNDVRSLIRKAKMNTNIELIQFAPTLCPYRGLNF